MLDDPEWPEGQAPHEIGRAQFGRISIANSDSEARPYMDAAVEAGWRAVAEQTLQSGFPGGKSTGMNDRGNAGYLRRSAVHRYAR